MATYTEAYNKDAPFYHPTGGGSPYAGITTSRELANGDIIKLQQVERDTKIKDAVVGASRQDTHATPTLAGVLELTDGTTTVALVTCGVTVLGSATASDRVARLNNPAAVGYIVPSRGFWLQFRVTAGPATVAAGTIGFAVESTNVMYGNESPVRPTG